MQSVDYIEECQGETVLLLHSTAAGNKQQKKLTVELSPKFKVIEANFFGYGTTPEWKSDQQQKLNDHVDLLNGFFYETDKFYIIGHSFSGSVAMIAARRFFEKIKKLILLDQIPFISWHIIHSMRHIKRQNYFVTQLR